MDNAWHQYGETTRERGSVEEKVLGARVQD